MIQKWPKLNSNRKHSHATKVILYKKYSMAPVVFIAIFVQKEELTINYHIIITVRKMDGAIMTFASAALSES